jgi:hypothetical protein
MHSARTTSRTDTILLPLIKGRMPSIRRASTTGERELAYLAVFGVATVIITVVDGLPGTTLPGLNDTVARSGRPEADRVTGAERLPCTFTKNEKFAEAPEVIVCVVALLAARLKSPGLLGGVFTKNKLVGDRLGSKLRSPE